MISNTAFEEHSRAKRARVEATDAVGLNVEQIHEQEQSLVKSSTERTEAFTSKALSWVGCVSRNYIVNSPKICF